MAAKENKKERTKMRLYVIALASMCMMLLAIGTVRADPPSVPPDQGWTTSNQINNVPAGIALFADQNQAWLDNGDAGQNIYITQQDHQSYNIWGEPKRVADAQGTQTTFTMSACGISQIQNPSFVQQRTTYASGCLPVEVYDENGQMTRTSYDALRRVERVVGPLDSVDIPTARYVYRIGNPQNDDNFIAIYKKANDGTGIQGDEESAVFIQERTFYDGEGKQYKTELRSEGDGTIVQQTQYQAATGLMQQTARPFYQWDGIDQNAWTAYAYANDPLRQQTSVNSPGAGQVSVTYTYDSTRNQLVATTTDENGRSTQTSTDAYGRMVRYTDANNKLWQYQYDAFGHIIATTPPDGGAVHTYQYDSLGRLWRKHDPEKAVFNAPQYDNTDAYEYDSRGNLITHYTALGFKEMRYDTFNRLTLVKYDEYASGYGMVPVIAYFYDGDDGPDNRCLGNNQYAKGRLCKVKRLVTAMPASQQPRILESSRAYGYDKKGRIIEEQVSVRKPDTSYAVHNIDYTYNSDGSIATETIDDTMRYVFIYDTLGRMYAMNLQRRSSSDEEFGAAEPVIMYVTYTATGAIDEMYYANSVQSEYTYTLRDWVESINTYRTGTPLFQRYFDYDDAGNLEQMHDGLSGNSDLLAAYTYDNLYRITGVQDSGYYGHSYGYTYDALGNRLTQTVDQSPAKTYQYIISENNKLRSIIPAIPSTATITFGYDPHGSLVNKQQTAQPTVTYAYNAYDNMLKSVDLQSDGTGDLAFTYDEADRRVTKLTPTGYSVYLYDASGSSVLVEDIDWGSG